jgi:hypothetical protein
MIIGRAILAQERAAQTTDPRIKEWWEDVARNWFFMPSMLNGYLESVYRPPDSTRGQPQQCNSNSKCSPHGIGQTSEPN